MKKMLSIAAIAITGLAAFSSCSKSSSSSPATSLTCTINGKAYSSTAYAGKNSTILTVFSYKGAGSITYPFVEVLLSNYASTGTYTVDGMTNNIVIDSSSTSAVGATSGTVTITSTSPIKGTFSATMTDGTTITGGAFTATAP